MLNFYLWAGYLDYWSLFLWRWQVYVGVAVYLAEAFTRGSSLTFHFVCSLFEGQSVSYFFYLTVCKCLSTIGFFGKNNNWQISRRQFVYDMAKKILLSNRMKVVSFWFLTPIKLYNPSLVDVRQTLKNLRTFILSLEIVNAVGY